MRLVYGQSQRGPPAIQTLRYWEMCRAVYMRGTVMVSLGRRYSKVFIHQLVALIYFLFVQRSKKNNICILFGAAAPAETLF